MAFDKRTLVLPPETVFEERTIVTKGDVIFGNHVKSSFGAKTEGRVFGGQGVHLEGDLEATADIRLDQSCHVMGDVRGGANVFLGERCFIQGDLSLEGDMDVGDDVRIGGQLKARGWVNKRSPVPMVIYIFIYLLELLRMGQSEEVERILRELEEAEEDEIAVDERFLFVPDDSELGLQASTIKGNLEAGHGCRVLGNLQVHGTAHIGSRTCLYGALRADGDITLGSHAEVQGDLVSAGHVVIGEGCQVLGDLKAKSVEMYTSATVDGKILADDGVRFRTESQDAAQEEAKEKVEAFDSKAADLVDLLG